MTPYAFADLFCGMGAIPYWLLGCKPPISYMGSKVGYADAIAAILGLSRHRRPAAIVLGDVGPTVAVHAGLFGAAGVTARDVAGWLTVCRRSWKGQPECGFLPRETTIGPKSHGGDWRYALDAPADEVGPLPHPRAAEVAAIIRGWKDEEPRALWTRLKAEGWPSLMPVEGGRWLGPLPVEEVAGFLFVAMRSWSNYEVGQVYKDYERHAVNGTRGDPLPPAPVLADRVGALSSIPSLACWQGTAARLVEQLPERLDSWITYMDPPYSGTTGYPFGDCPREEVLRIALDLHRRGATVAISEAVRLDGELGEEWHAVRIDSERKGQKRTFSVQQSEWLTLNRPPVTRPGVQVGLWGAS